MTSSADKKGWETGGVKFDQGKPRFDLIDAETMEELAKVLAFGAQKYAEENWRKGISFKRLIAAAERHIAEIKKCNDFDDETKLQHAAHAMCCMMFLSWMQRHRKDMDDRYRSDKPAGPMIVNGGLLTPEEKRALASAKPGEVVKSNLTIDEMIRRYCPIDDIAVENSFHIVDDGAAFSLRKLNDEASEEHATNIRRQAEARNVKYSGGGTGGGGHAGFTATGKVTPSEQPGVRIHDIDMPISGAELKHSFDKELFPNGRTAEVERMDALIENMAHLTSRPVSPEEIKALLATPVTPENLQPGRWVKLAQHAYGEKDDAWCVLGDTPPAAKDAPHMYHLARINSVGGTACLDVSLDMILEIV